MIFALACVLCAKNAIIDTSKILKENQSVVIDARTNSIRYVLEILPNGHVVKKYLSPAQQEALQKELQLELTSQPSDNQHQINTTQNGTSQINKKSHIKEWNKRKIIYELQEEIIRLKR